MRRADLAGLALATVCIGIAPACTGARAPERAHRAYDGAPPVIPHEPFGSSCASCHGDDGPRVAGLGFAPRSPHRSTEGMSSSRCRQCHVFQQVTENFIASTFVGLQSDPAPAHRAHALAPPVIPHRSFMREDCLSCHSGPAARDAVRTTHPERTHCRQCHLSPEPS